MSIYQHSNERKARFVPHGLKQTQELLETKKFLSPMDTRQTENVTSNATKTVLLRVSPQSRNSSESHK